MATRLGLSSAPAIAEAMAVARDLCLVEETGAALHFRQLTTARALGLVREAKARGLPVTCGITPAHLFQALQHRLGPRHHRGRQAGELGDVDAVGAVGGARRAEEHTS